MDVLHEVADKVTEAIVDLSEQVEELANRLEWIHETLTEMADSLALLALAPHNHGKRGKDVYEAYPLFPGLPRDAQEGGH